MIYKNRFGIYDQIGMDEMPYYIKMCTHLYVIFESLNCDLMSCMRGFQNKDI